MAVSTDFDAFDLQPTQVDVREPGEGISEGWLVTTCAITAVLSFIALATLSYTIVADFETMFAEFGLELPAPTETLLGIARVVRWYPIPLALVMICGAILGAVIWPHLVRLAQSVPVLRWFVRGNTQSLEDAARLCEIVAERWSSAANTDANTKVIEQAMAGDEVPCFRQPLRLLIGQIKGELSVDAPRGPLPANFVHAVCDAPTRDDGIAILRASASNLRHRIRVRRLTHAGIASPWWVFAIGGVMMFVIVALFMPLVSLISGLS